MKTVLAALAAALVLSACSLTIDPNGVKPPPEKTKQEARGACVDAAGGHKLCGGEISGGGSAHVAAASGHAVARSEVGAGAVPQLSSSQHQIVRGAVSP